MNRITPVLKGRGSRKLLVPFLTVGYPSLASSLDLARAAIDSGADMLELGMPFSDPLADGPQVQLSSQIALENGINLQSVLRAVTTLRAHSDVPVILMGYVNPVLTFGVPQFLGAARSAGVDGLIIPDLPFEEPHSYRSHMAAYGLSTIFLVAPTTTIQRTRLIEDACSDFVYAVTVTGVTGARMSFDATTDEYLKRLKQQLSKPVIAGFGVSSADTAKRLAEHADGVVIGSKLITLVQESRGPSESVRHVGAFLSTIRQALNKL